MAVKKYKLDDFFRSAQVAILNSIEQPEIAEAVAIYGYNKAKLNNGKALYEKVMNLHTKQVREYSEQFGATDDFHAKFESADKNFKKFVKIAKIAIKDREKASKLYIYDRKSKRFSKWQVRAIGRYHFSHFIVF